MELVAEKRETLGKTARKLKGTGKIAAVMYGKETPSTALVVDLMAYTKVYNNAGETDLIDLKIGKETHKVLIKNSQFDPVKDKIIHAELFAPNLKEKTEANIPVEVINAELNPLVKSGAALILTLINEIRVSALPADLPHSFIIDASKFAEIGDGITAGDLDFDKEKVELVDLEPTDVIVKLDKVENLEEEPTAAETEADALSKLEATSEKKVEENADGEKGSADKGGKSSAKSGDKGDKGGKK